MAATAVLSRVKGIAMKIPIGSKCEANETMSSKRLPVFVEGFEAGLHRVVVVEHSASLE
jgi:hypothetical protein